MRREVATKPTPKKSDCKWGRNLGDVSASLPSTAYPFLGLETNFSAIRSLNCACLALLLLACACTAPRLTEPSVKPGGADGSSATQTQAITPAIANSSMGSSEKNVERQGSLQQDHASASTVSCPANGNSYQAFQSIKHRLRCSFMPIMIARAGGGARSARSRFSGRPVEDMLWGRGPSSVAIMPRSRKEFRGRTK